MRNDRRAGPLRPIRVTRRFTKTPAGSVLREQGEPVVLCKASVTQDLPPWFGEDRAGGWITAD
jgi:ribonuclease PH